MNGTRHTQVDPTGATSLTGQVNRTPALVLDVAIVAAAFLILAPGSETIARAISSLTAASLCSGTSLACYLVPSFVGWLAPGVLWTACVIGLARRGQSPGTALLRLKWVEHEGGTALWHTLGSPLLLLDLLFPLVVSCPLTIWALAAQAPSLGSISVEVVALAVYLVVVLGVATAAHRVALRHPATLARRAA